MSVAVVLEAGGGFADTVHGGRSLALITSAALSACDRATHPHPVSVSAVYAAATRPGPALVTVRTLKAGRTFVSLHASLEQNGVAAVEAFVTAGTLPPLDEPARWDAGTEPAPELPDPEDCVGGSRHAQSRERLSRQPVNGAIAVRLDPASAPPPYGAGGRGDYRGWVRSETEPDPYLAAVLLCDALPPVTLDIGMAGVWVPTVQMTVTLRRQPPTGWLKARQWGALMAGGLLDERCTLWAPSGEVVAQASQLAAYREPR